MSIISLFENEHDTLGKIKFTNIPIKYQPESFLKHPGSENIKVKFLLKSKLFYTKIRLHYKI